MVLLVLVLVAGAFAISPTPLSGGRGLRILGGAIALGLFVAVFYLAYAGWNAVGAPRIDEFQGRYLLPVVALITLVCVPGVPRAVRVSKQQGPAATGAILAGCAALAIWTTVGMLGFFYF
jgi:uncharacterized membrane protein